MEQMNYVPSPVIIIIVSVVSHSSLRWIRWGSQVTSDCFPITGIGRFENTIFFLTIPTTLQLDELGSVERVLGESRTMASFPSSGSLFPEPPVRTITANGFCSDAIVPSRRWCPMSRLGFSCTKNKNKRMGQISVFQVIYLILPLSHLSSISPLVFHYVRWGGYIRFLVSLVTQQGRLRRLKFWPGPRVVLG